MVFTRDYTSDCSTHTTPQSSHWAHIFFFLAVVLVYVLYSTHTPGHSAQRFSVVVALGGGVSHYIYLFIYVLTYIIFQYIKDLALCCSASEYHSGTPKINGPRDGLDVNGLEYILYT